MKVLFVCTGNAHRSPLAAALLTELRPEWKVDSAGLHVAIPISSQVREYLRKEGSEPYLKKSPEGLDGKQLESYDIIVAMEQRHKDAVVTRCPQCEGKVAVWNIRDPYFMDDAEALTVYDEIKARVTELAQTSNERQTSKPRG